MFRVTAANPNLTTNPTNPNPIDLTHPTDPNGGDVLGSTRRTRFEYMTLLTVISY